MEGRVSHDEVRAAVAATARMLARAGLVRAFGHVSARVGADVAITSVRPMATATPDDVVVVTGGGAPVAGPADELPIETPMHLAVLAARPDVGAICRGHPAAAIAWGAHLRPLPLLHGLGALAGRHVAVHDDLDLIADRAAGEAVARTLGEDHAVLLHANGGLAVGATLAEAATRLWYLEERAAVALAAPDRPHVDDVTWRMRMRHSPAELARAQRWFTSAFADPT